MQACGRASVRAGGQACVRACVRACGRAGVRAGTRVFLSAAPPNSLSHLSRSMRRPPPTHPPVMLRNVTSSAPSSKYRPASSTGLPRLRTCKHVRSRWQGACRTNHVTHSPCHFTSVELLRCVLCAGPPACPPAALGASPAQPAHPTPAHLSSGACLPHVVLVSLGHYKVACMHDKGGSSSSGRAPVRCTAPQPRQ